MPGLRDHGSSASPAIHGGVSEAILSGAEGSPRSWRGSSGLQVDLTQFQRRFVDAVRLGGVAEAPLLAVCTGEPEANRRRLAAYRRSINGTLHRALEATYPLVAAIVGPAFFGEAARQFIVAHPSQSGDLNDYGGEFAEFLAAYSHADDLPYLPDVARLEWAVQAVYYAVDSGPADLSVLAALPPERYGELRFSITPAHARLDSPWPLDAIWRVNQEGYEGDMEVDFSRPARVLVLREGGRVQVASLDPGEAVLFDALAAGETLGAAATRGDPGPALQRFAAAGLLCRAFL